MCFLRVVSGVLFIAIVIPKAICQEADSEQSVSLKRVQNYTMVESEAERNYPLKFIEQSALNWSNPVFGTTDGAVFIWVRDERPSAVLKTYQTKNSTWFEQVRSFSRHPIIARESKDGKVFWSPPATPEMKPLENAPVPADNPAARLTQMKVLHQSFSVTGKMVPGNQPEMRPLPQPIYRYQSDKIIDGAILAFVQGTAPDMLLILEAREMDGKRQWFYQLGSIGIFAVDVQRDGKMVWQEERREAQTTKPTDIYDGRRLP